MNQHIDNNQMIRQTATLGGGCFWCLEAIYDDLKGIERVESGYAGGNLPNPTYEQVCSGTTGHAEVVQLVFNPNVISYREILQIFFTIHDPTTLNRQGGDVGTQYRSMIFYHDEAQREIAEEVIWEIQAAGLWPDPIVTDLAPIHKFYKAEDYHQEYFANNPNQTYCQVIIAPKVAKFRKMYMEKLER
jgi:peptide-methionine (S)-S-oxide reductase